MKMNCKDCDDLFCEKRSENGTCIRVIMAPDGMMSDVAEEVINAVATLTSKCWTCIAPGGIDPLALNSAAKDLVDVLDAYLVCRKPRPMLVTAKEKLKKQLWPTE